MFNFKSLVLLTVGAAASVAMVGAAAAADSRNAPKMVVHYKPADLQTEEGIQKVYQRIRQAAQDVCPAIETGTYLASVKTLQCRQTAIAAAVDAIHNKRLAEIATESSKSA